jgi:hypothetical protein
VNDNPAQNQECEQGRRSGEKPNKQKLQGKALQVNEDTVHGQGDKSKRVPEVRVFEMREREDGLFEMRVPEVGSSQIEPPAFAPLAVSLHFRPADDENSACEALGVPLRFATGRAFVLRIEPLHIAPSRQIIGHRPS